MRNASFNAMRRYRPASGSVPPLTRKGEATRQRILEAATKEIGLNGYHIASVSSITSEAGVGQGTFYLYFKSKDDLLVELVGKLTNELRELLLEASKNAASRLAAERACIQTFLKYVYENQRLYRVFMECQFINPQLHQSSYQDFANHWVKLLDEASQHGEIVEGDNEVRAWAMMGMHHLLAMRFSVWSNQAPDEEIIDQAVALIRDGISTRSANC
ncbi:MAG: TetR/AcrR family transcriptional regulator [Gammaproteobacteria bacterium]|nr:TetR/AcrR family transcriptional regulator [Gammaproteobacteria bacterium]